MARLAYYPGCSLRHSAVEFDHSTRVVLESVGVDYEIVPDWTCCGASPAHMTDHLLAQALATRNLRQAQEVGDEMLAPCPACYQREKNAEVEVHGDDELRAEVNEVMDQPYEGQVRVWNLPEFLKEKVGLTTLAKLAQTDLSQLKVVPYYGCLLARPTEITGECDTEQPMVMDQLLAAAGADVVWWNYKTECCGASVGVPNKIIQQRLTEKILDQARQAGADAIVTACPLCHQNLDMRQHQTNAALGTDHHMPILYLTQVIGLSLGFSPQDMMLHKHLIDPTSAVESAVEKAAEVRAEEERKAQEKAEKARKRAAKSKKKEAAEASGDGSEGGEGSKSGGVGTVTGEEWEESPAGRPSPDAEAAKEAAEPEAAKSDAAPPAKGETDIEADPTRVQPTARGVEASEETVPLAPESAGNEVPVEDVPAPAGGLDESQVDEKTGKGPAVEGDDDEAEERS